MDDAPWISPSISITGEFSDGVIEMGWIIITRTRLSATMRATKATVWLFVCQSVKTSGDLHPVSHTSMNAKQADRYVVRENENDKNAWNKVAMKGIVNGAKQ